MKILIINPNSDNAFTQAIQRCALAFADRRYEVETVGVPTAPQFIETYEDGLQATNGMVEIVRRREVDCDAFIVACHCDPGLDVLKEITTKPVVGIGEASMKLASFLGDRFSVVTFTKHSVPGKRALIRAYGLNGSLASVKTPIDEAAPGSNEEIFFEVSRRAVEEDDAEVIVLGCGGLVDIDKSLQKRLGVPVLDGVVCALIVAAGFVDYGVSTSKIRRYNPQPHG